MFKAPLPHYPHARPRRSSMPAAILLVLVVTLASVILCITPSETLRPNQIHPSLLAAASPRAVLTEQANRAKDVARPVGAFVALHCALVTSKAVIGRGLKGISSYLGYGRHTNPIADPKANTRRGGRQSLASRAEPPKAAHGNAMSIKARKLAGDWQLADAGKQDIAMRMMGLGYLFRKATALAKGLSLRVTEDEFQITTKASIIEKSKWSRIRYFNLTTGYQIMERYPFNGQPRRFSRRDKRGQHEAKIAKVHDGVVELHVEWGQPAAGTLIQTFKLDPKNPNRLNVEHQLALEVDATTGRVPNPRVMSYQTVYTRRA